MKRQRCKITPWKGRNSANIRKEITFKLPLKNSNIIICNHPPSPLCNQNLAYFPSLPLTSDCQYFPHQFAQLEAQTICEKRKRNRKCKYKAMNNKKPSSYLLTCFLLPLLLLLFAWKAAELSVLPVAHISPFFPSLCRGTYSVREKKNRHNLNNKLVCFKQLHSSKPLFNTLDGC